MRTDWQQEIDAAQSITSYNDGNQDWQRIKYGEETGAWAGFADTHPHCPDCAVAKGQYHVPGCDIERCPRCGGQVIGCYCCEDEEED